MTMTKTKAKAKAKAESTSTLKSRERRKALRDELYARIARGDISLIETVRLMRKVAARSQADYARLVGVSPRILIELERGIGNPTIKTLAKILAPFDLEVGVRRRLR